MTFKSFNVVELLRENDLSKVIKQHKREATPFTILFISLWDDNSSKILEGLKEAAEEENDTLYVVDSFNMPHSFVIYNTHVVPALVRVHKDNVEVTEYLPHVYKHLEVS